MAGNAAGRLCDPARDGSVSAWIITGDLYPIQRCGALPLHALSLMTECWTISRGCAARSRARLRPAAFLDRDGVLGPRCRPCRVDRAFPLDAGRAGGGQDAQRCRVVRVRRHQSDQASHAASPTRPMCAPYTRTWRNSSRRHRGRISTTSVTARTTRRARRRVSPRQPTGASRRPG